MIKMSQWACRQHKIINFKIFKQYKNEKHYLGFRMPKIWHILKRISGKFFVEH
jgi:hypothetical protein